MDDSTNDVELLDAAVSDSDGEILEGARSAGKDVLGRKTGHVVAPEDRQPIRPETHGLWTGMDDQVNCPPDYATWWEQYRDETFFWVRKTGIDSRQVEDTVNEIMTRFIERDSLGVFRREWKTRSITKKSRFQSYYSKFVVGYASGKHRNHVRYVKRNLAILDAPVGEDGTTWADLKAPHHTDTVEADMEFAEIVAALRTRVPDPEVVDAMLFLVEDTGRVTQGKLAAHLETEPGAARSALNAVRSALRDLVGEDAVRGRKRA
ncbi:MAG: hypothetical protein WC054_00525 [Candidatus Nanopelagicales bacterium]